VTLAAAAVVTAVVWAVSMIRSVRLRALVYSLPLPMTLVLAAGDVRVDGAQVSGVALLVLFFAVVTVAYERFGWPVLPADVAGVLAYVLAGAVLARAGPVPFWPAVCAACLIWVAVEAVRRRRARTRQRRVRTRQRRVRTRQPAPEPTPDGARRRTVPAVLGRLAGVFAASLLMLALGGLLKGLVVTFPYSGVLVAVEARGHLRAFTGHVARASLALIGFVTGYRLLQDRGTAAALAAGWTAFAVVAAALHVTGRRPDAGPAGGRDEGHPGRGGPVRRGS